MRGRIRGKCDQVVEEIRRIWGCPDVSGEGVLLIRIEFGGREERIVGDDRDGGDLGDMHRNRGATDGVVSPRRRGTIRRPGSWREEGSVHSDTIAA